MPDPLTITTLESQGFTHIEARCTCGSITCLPFRLLKLQGKATHETTMENIVSRLRCERCGASPEKTRPWRQYIDQRPDPDGPAKTWGLMPPGVKGL